MKSAVFRLFVFFAFSTASVLVTCAYAHAASEMCPATAVVPWVYTTENGDEFFEENPNSFQGALAALNALLLGIPGGVMDTVNSPTYEKPADMATIVNATMQGGFHEHFCFSADLPPSELG